MTQKITNMSKVLDPWLEEESDPELRKAVLRKLMWIGNNIHEIESWSAVPGKSPLFREIEVDEGALITFSLTRPNVGAHLLAITTLQ